MQITWSMGFKKIWFEGTHFGLYLEHRFWVMFILSKFVISGKKIVISVKVTDNF